MTFNRDNQAQSHVLIRSLRSKVEMMETQILSCRGRVMPITITRETSRWRSLVGQLTTPWSTSVSYLTAILIWRIVRQIQETEAWPVQILMLVSICIPCSQWQKRTRKVRKRWLIPLTWTNLSITRISKRDRVVLYKCRDLLNKWKQLRSLPADRTTTHLPKTIIMEVQALF